MQNKAPRSYRYVGYNLESPLFKDKRVRRAISHLFDRDMFIEKFQHGLQTKAVGPFAANSRYTSPRVKQIEFSVPSAQVTHAPMLGKPSSVNPVDMKFSPGPCVFVLPVRE